jgi:hypothetical protein
MADRGDAQTLNAEKNVEGLWSPRSAIFLHASRLLARPGGRPQTPPPTWEVRE